MGIFGQVNDAGYRKLPVHTLELVRGAGLPCCLGKSSSLLWFSNIWMIMLHCVCIDIILLVNNFPAPHITAIQDWHVNKCD